MIKLLIAADAPDEREVATRFGGRPLSRADIPFDWPTCAACALHPPMLFLGQIAVPGEAQGNGERAVLLSLFMCDGRDGCETWEADGGANRVIVVTGSGFLELKSPPVTDETTIRSGGFYGAEQVSVPNTGRYDAARAAWATANGGAPQRLVLGQLGGAPEWLQGDQTPTCSSCGEPMAFIAQLEEGPDPETTMNFGGGCAYVFRCGDHGAKMLWQQ